MTFFLPDSQMPRNRQSEEGSGFLSLGKPVHQNGRLYAAIISGRRTSTILDNVPA